MSKSALEKVRSHAEAGLRARERFFAEQSELLVDTARTFAVCLAKGARFSSAATAVPPRTASTSRLNS